jgi:hypothetical protein
MVLLTIITSLYYYQANRTSRLVRHHPIAGAGGSSLFVDSLLIMAGLSSNLNVSEGLPLFDTGASGSVFSAGSDLEMGVGIVWDL